MTDEDIIRHQNATHCHICGEKLNGDCVKDHNHYTGKYRGPAHNECNVNFKAKKKIPVIMHGLKNCDGHFIIKEANKYKFDNISCIPLNKEKYLTFTLDQLQFIDSQQFMNESLEILTNNLKLDKDYNKTTELFHHTKKYYQGDEIELITENHTELKSDVLLLADVFENFRAISMKNYELDPCHYITAPQLSWDAMLLHLRKYKDNGGIYRLKLISDIDKYNYFEQDKRGGIASIGGLRMAKANNKYLKDYDETKESSYIINLDCNNLYGHVMSEYLPYDDFKVEDPNKFTKEYIMNLKSNNKKGYRLKVDLGYPKHLHTLHNDFPLAPESMFVTHDMLSPQQKSIVEEYNLSVGKTKSLITNLRDKKNYGLRLYYSPIIFKFRNGIKKST